MVEEEERQALTKRVEALERRNRRSRRLGAVGLTAGLLVALLGWQTPPAPAVVEATELRIVDAAGELRARIGPADPEDEDASAGDVRLTFVGGQGFDTASFGLVDGRPQLRFEHADLPRLRVGPDQVIFGHEGDHPLERQVFTLDRSGFRGSNRWSEDTDRPDVQASLVIPKDDLAPGPGFTLALGDRGPVHVGYTVGGGPEVMIDGRRVFFGQDGAVRWEPEGGG